MFIKQISIFIDNKPGRLAHLIKSLADEQINIHALSLADTTDFGIVRLIVDRPGKAVEVLKRHNAVVKITDVVGLVLEHHPGSLAKTLEELEKAGVSIEYIYAFTTSVSDTCALVILRLENQDEAVEKMKSCDVRMPDEEMIGRLFADE